MSNGDKAADLKDVRHGRRGTEWRLLTARVYEDADLLEVCRRPSVVQRGGRPDKTRMQGG